MKAYIISQESMDDLLRRLELVALRKQVLRDDRMNPASDEQLFADIHRVFRYEVVGWQRDQEK